MAKSRQRRQERANLLELVPRMVADWRLEGDRVVLELPAPASPWRAPLAWLGAKLSARRVRLDEVGSFAWSLFDGERTVAEVADALRREFGGRIEPAEERLGHLVRMLRRGGLILYAAKDDDGGAGEQRDVSGR